MLVLKKSRYDLIEDFLPIDNTICILDYGCGDSHFVKRLKQNGYKNVVGVDLHTEKHIGDIQNNSVDVVVSIAVMEHVLDLREYLTNAKRVLKKDGFFIIAVHNGTTFNSFFPSYLVR